MTGRWIWTGKDAAPANQFTWFRTVVDLRRAPESTRLRFAADSTAQLWVNGALVRRKVTRFHEPSVRADVVELAAHLRPGRNVVVVLHHSWGDIVTFQRTGNVQAGLYLDGAGLDTDESWRWTPAEEFEHTEQFQGIADGAPRIRYPVRWNPTGREDPAGYHDPAYDDSRWQQAVAVGAGPWPSTPDDVETPAQRESDQAPLSVLAAGSVGAGGNLEPDPEVTRLAGDLVRARPHRIEGRAGETHYVTVDLQRPVHGYPYIEVETDAEVELELRYGELAVSPYSGLSLVTADGRIDVDGVVAIGYADTLLPVPSRRRYEIPDERTARWISVYVSFRSTGAITLLSLGVVKSQYPIELRGTFECGDPRVDQLVSLTLTHAEVTMSDAYVDTPGREDGQWIEDARPRAILASRWFGDVRLRRLMIRTLTEGQNADGNLHPFYPSNFPYGSSQWDWSLQWVGMIVDDYRWTADRAFLGEYFPAIERFWAGLIPQVRSDGIWREARVFGDVRNSAALADGDSSGIVTPWVIDRLRDSAMLARALGSARANSWDELAQRMTTAFRALHITDNNPLGVHLVADSVDADGNPSGFSQAGQIVPLYDGLLTADEAASVIEAVFPAPDGSPPAAISRWNNPTWSYRVLRALSEHDLDERALSHLLERYGPYLPGHPDNQVGLALQGPYGGPLPEYWVSRQDLGLGEGEINDRLPVDPTGSHGWGAMPLLWLHEYLLGVTITTPGGGELAISPAAAGLPFVTGTTMTPKGAVYVHFEPSAPSLVVEIPQGARARVQLPGQFDGLTVSVNGEFCDRSAPLLLEGGRWEFLATGVAW